MKKRDITSLLLPILLFSAASCSKDSKIETIESVKFSASYEDGAQTKSTAAFTMSNKSTIYGYTSGAVLSSASPMAGLPVEATATAAGILTPASSVFLPKGLYDFYSVSLNNSSSPAMNFTSGTSDQLSNGNDYLWAKAVNVAEGGTASFSYKHRAVLVQVNVAAGTGVTNLSVLDIKIDKPTAGTSSKMTLADGMIGSATAIGSTVESMAGSGNSRSSIILPLSSLPLKVEIYVNATIGGNNVTNKKYSATIPAQQYSGGTKYSVNFTISASALTFTGAQIEDWTSSTITPPSITEN